MSPEIEEELVLMAIQGDHDAFKQLIELYQHLVFALIFNITRDYQETENLAQETFLQVYRSLPQYRFKGLKNWICRIATNKAIDWRRSSPVREQQVTYMELLSRNNYHNSYLEDHVLKKDELEKLMLLCNRLPDKYSKVIEKYFMQSKSYQQIAEEEGISIRTVETRLYRAKKMLRKGLEGGGS